VSRDVLVKPTIEYAETAAETDIETQAGLTQSRGMRLYMRTQQAELLSAVRGRYVSRSNQRGLSPR
jgi:lipopolysaccharide export system protein LptC